jgi:hypothetical protein
MRALIDSQEYFEESIRVGNPYAVRIAINSVVTSGFRLRAASLKYEAKTKPIATASP